MQDGGSFSTLESLISAVLKRCITARASGSRLQNKAAHVLSLATQVPLRARGIYH